MNKIKVGIVGLGRLGRKHAENIALRISNAELTAVCSVIKDEVDEAYKKLNVKYGYTDFDEMIKNKELDAIFISSPSGFHCSQIEKALKAGFHVFSEKPLGLYLEETKKLAKVVNEYRDKQIFMLGFMRRYDKSYLYAKEKIEHGEIGKPMLIRCYGLDPSCSIESFLSFAKNNYSGGLFLDMAIHDLDLARWYLNSEAEKVWAIGDAYEYEDFKEINDAETGAALVKFKNGTIGIFVAGRNCAHGYHIETEIIGTKGSLRIGTIPEKNMVTVFNDKGAIRECYQGFLERFEQAYLSETEDFINCIMEKRQPKITVEDGVNSTALAYACKESFETGKLIELK
ncbi:myo-inositol 2-dehydrogenase [Clostridium tetani]|uniref:Inositol 2-dehydrogenase n=1 Tax=Clostridium tetani TaxID=1513 RepID=A0A4V1LEF6_CLOTA|nr:Gfo/Idh/MocA family oxidoreductase [Clostridium tetani]AVP55360.1 inositol 2-dehydrogenase [Clostridium tetani]RXI45723.1 inositol 2-dehydrogenase [Clostridium tetani]RXI77304.1 inositol 2-dehydrogenase [Clostridium tetani]WFN62347.1 Gfo/Idh/MocA family oxidoreductase [Clostridium tetani]SUY54530.1 myo-inositol 2-dehydrogenase [Clostridium tetani]